jgi:hypothetical protein
MMRRNLGNHGNAHIEFVVLDLQLRWPNQVLKSILVNESQSYLIWVMSPVRLKCAWEGSFKFLKVTAFGRLEARIGYSVPLRKTER